MLQDVPQRGTAVHGWGKGCASSKSSSQALVVSKSFRSLCIPREHQGQAYLSGCSYRDNENAQTCRAMCCSSNRTFTAHLLSQQFTLQKT